MERYTNFVIRRKKGIVVVFLLLAAASLVLMAGVRVNYDIASYLPASAQSTTALRIMDAEFDQATPNASVMIRDVTIPQALEYKARLSQLEGVREVLWLDDAADLKTPLEYLDTELVETYYKDRCALYSVTVEEGLEPEAVSAIRELIGDGGAVTGEAVDTSYLRTASVTEAANAMVIIVAAILALLVLFTTSWGEPLLFIAVIGVSILINMGTNALLKQVSYLTNTVSPILQLAVSLDYAVFLLHSFTDYKKEGCEPEEAMRRAMKKSVKAVAASAVTTLCGFIALSFMEFGIGADLGLNLTKGVLLSFISSMVFLPALALQCHKWLERTEHRPFLPSFRNVNRGLSRISLPAMVLALLVAVPCFLGQSRVGFLYGNSDSDPDSRSAQDAAAIREEFGQSTPLVLLVPRGDVAKEYALGQALRELDHVTGVVSYAAQVGTGIPSEFLDESVTSQFYSEHYARIIVYLDTETEGDEAFAAVEAVNGAAGRYYDEFYSAGQSANLYDMKNIVRTDNLRVTLIVVLSIFAVLLVTFRSAILPFILLLTIEVGIWINLAIPYFLGTSLNFIGYLVISTVQLGATVDYAILLTSYYLDDRKLLGRREAMDKAMGEVFQSTLLSGCTLTVAGFTLFFSSSAPIISGLGLLLGRGTLLSLLMVYTLLPGLLRVLDRPIGALTWHAGFFPAPGTPRNENGRKA